MKMTNIYNKVLLGAALVCTGLMASCEDYLTILPTDSIPEENFWQSKGDVDNVRAAAYYQLTKEDALSKILYWGEFRSDNVELKDMTKTSVSHMMEGVLQPTENMFKWDTFYSGISYCNKVLEKAQEMIDNDVDQTFKLGAWRPIKAEMLSLRALYYFYLVRAYRDVPFMTKTISTDAEALEARKGVPATQGVVILDSLIKDLEDCKEYAAKNYGNSLDNKGRFTKRSVRTLLADMYLWQGCMLKHGIDKGYLLLNEQGDTIKTQSELDTKATANFQRAIELCDEVMKEMQDDYKKEIDKNPNQYTEVEKKQPYPLYQISQSGTTTEDKVYNYVWGRGNSDESIFDLQYDGDQNSNTVLGSLYYNSSNKSARTIVGKPSLFTTINTLDNDGTLKGFSKTDIRLHESVTFTDITQSEYPIWKNSVENVSFEDKEDMSRGGDAEPRATANANWPVYRISDLMLIKAECIARLGFKENSAELVEGFQLVNKLFARYNPGLDSTGSGKVNTSDRLKYDFFKDKNASALLELVYRERQREFFSEGKRWFDIVRQAESDNNTTEVLSSWVGASKSLQTRLRKLAAMYVPYYNDELKVNPALKQNEVWDKYTPNSSKPTEN